MPLRKKINIKVYTLLSTLLLILSYLLSKNISEFIAMLIVFIAVMLNQWMLLNFVESIIEDTLNKGKTNKGNLITNFVMKSLLVVVAISFGVHIMGNRIIIPILIYIAQIFVLYFSMIKKEVD